VTWSKIVDASRILDGLALAVGGELGGDRERSWEPLPLYEDNDISAWSGKLRPEYERLLADVAARRVDVVVVLHPDRLHRQPEEFEQFRRTCVAAGMTQLVSCYGDVDLTNPDALLVARVMTATAAHQSDSTSRRVRAMHRRLAREGRFAGGPQAFGWTWKRAELDPNEAAEVRQAAAGCWPGRACGPSSRT
jgi:site-specific DNA recombinase